MPFELLPVIDTMLGLYRLPRTPERFRAYLDILQGDSKDDLRVPVGAYNPMAKEHVPEQLARYKAMGAEDIIRETLAGLNAETGFAETIRVAFALADDLMGGWTNRYTSDFDLAFKLNALVTRNFCTPVFWTSESDDERSIRHRTRAACYRTLYWKQHPKPVTLADHLAQEVFVATKARMEQPPLPSDPLALRKFYEQHRDTTEYALIFNFFYGDEAAQSLGFPAYGVAEAMGGFKYAQTLTPQSLQQT